VSLAHSFGTYLRGYRDNLLQFVRPAFCTSQIEVPSPQHARNLHTATLLPSGAVLIAGGGDDNSTAELYDPTTGSFSTTGGMEVGRSRHSATLLPGGSVLVIGGGSYVGIASAELYQEKGAFDY
jgi:hypothetical protein